MNQQFQRGSSKVTLLSLGAGESRKSTIFNEKQQSTQVVHDNTIASMKTLCAETKNMGCDGEEVVKERLQFVLGIDDQCEINEEIGVVVKELWTNPGMLQAWKW